MLDDDGHGKPGSDDDEDSLFGSPPPSPARGRSPQLALPTGPGSSENVGTIALPGSHSHIEHPLDPAALTSLRPGTRHPEPQPAPSTSQLPPPPSHSRLASHTPGRVGRPPGRASKQAVRSFISQPVHTGVTPACVDSRYLTGQQSAASTSGHTPLQPLSPFHRPHAFNLSPPPPESSPVDRSGSSTPISSIGPSSASSRAGSQVPRPQKTQKSKKTTAHRPPPIEIPLPDPSAPPPTGFLRNQQALLGRAGLVGKVNPAHLSKHHSRGAAHNPIPVLDDYDPPPIGQGSAPMDVSQLPPPSSEEIIKSLIRQKNIFPVLESILRLLSRPGTHLTRKPSAFFTRDFSELEEQEPANKRRRLSSVPAGAADWDIPYPFANGEGPEKYIDRWEAERVKRLLAQLVGLVKGAARSAATRTYIQQQRSSRGDTVSEGASRARSSSLSSEQAGLRSRSEDIGYVSNIQSSRDVSSPLQDNAALDQFISSLLGKMAATQTTPEPSSAASQVSAERPGSMEPVSGEDSSAPLDFSSPEFEEFMTMFKDSSIPPLEPSDSSCFESEPIPRDEASSSSTPAMDPTFQPHTTTSDSMIDPQLLGMSASPVGSFQQFDNQGSAGGSVRPPTPNLVQSPEASTSSFAGPPTPHWEELQMEPEVQQDPGPPGPPMTSTRPSPHAPDPFCLRWTTPIYQQLSYPPPHPQNLSTPAPPLPATLPPPQRLHSVLDPKRLAQSSVTTPANKQDIIRRAKERRAQLLAELERAKIQLWETTIEQGVLAHLAKDSG